MATTLTSTGITFPDATTQTTAAASAFPSGTLMLFQQTTAPTGWTKQTTHDNKALRVVTGTAGSGGTTAFTSVFTNQTPTITVTNSATTLATTQIPAHAHFVTKYNGSIAITGGTGYSGLLDSNADITRLLTYGTSSARYAPTPPDYYTGNGGGGESHTHANTASSSAITLNVQYVDLIIASKN